MTLPDSIQIKAYHAHLYYQDQEGLIMAQALAQQASDLFDIRVGRFHQKPVGPHPLWSCQLSFAADAFADVIPWLMMNRRSLDVFVHPLTGDDYLDHTQGVSWLGQSHTLDTSQFRVKNVR
ncbi:DOPA 4,5-dioxygenase family protein [Marinomonas posidonica]|uniref:Dopa 45-dioxygenase n=1 Tax=Marinomonas posidonica (strain CECT 7376 / NCIMB 14433 / IVIA-Po-181) TaxID=491952 RepID=F6CW87_MARPP|nr:DOPA 4,5-dioxygenase family protein [Marinomonas posidonica]AEF55448.1 Dopa 45-dioxygenase [Marinomonas posidonica IVIA-Po-181]